MAPPDRGAESSDPAQLAHAAGRSATEAGPDPDRVPGSPTSPGGTETSGEQRETTEAAGPGPGPAGENSESGYPTPGIEAHFAEIPVDHVRPNPRQPRQVFDSESMDELVLSLKEVGLLQPVVVRRMSGDHYELVMGERRWRACRLAGFDTMPAIVRTTDDDKLLLDALLENLHRSALNPLEEAAAYDQLLQDFACTHDVLAQRVGRSRSQVTNTLRLLRLAPPVQRKVAAGVLSAGHARALLMIEDPEHQQHVAGRIVAEGLSVRSTEEIAALGETAPAPGRRARAGRRRSPALDDLAASLTDRWDTKVTVALGQKRGRIVVEFASVEDLQRLVDLMAPGSADVAVGPGRNADQAE